MSRTHPPLPAAPAPDDAGYRALFERLPVGMYRTTPDGRLVDANPALVRLAGFPTREALLAAPLDFIWVDPAQRAEWQARLERDGVVHGFEYRARRADGTVVRVRDTAHALRDASGAVVAYEGVVEDVTAHARAEDGLRFAADLLAHVGEAVAASDTEARVTYWNRAAERLWGWTAAEAMGRRIDAFAPAPALRPHAEAIHRATLEGVSWAGEFQGAHRDGHVFPIVLNVAPTRDAAGRIVGTVAVCTDISRQKREERVQRILAEAGRILASSLDVEETLSAVVRLAVPDLADGCLVDVVEPGGALRPVDAHHADPACADTLRALRRDPAGADPDSRVSRVARTGAPWWEPDLPAAGLETITRCPQTLALLRTLDLRSAIAVPMVARGRTVGVLRFCTCGARTLGADDVALAEELARRAALAVDNARLYAQAQAAVRARERILRAVSHDLRSPLGAVVAHADLLRADAPEGTARHGWATVARGAAAHMERMIADLLDAAQLEAGQPLVEPAACAPADLLREAASLLAPAASAAGVRLRVAAGAALPPMWADRGRVLQVLGNLVHNAVRVSPRGGVVTVRAERCGGVVRLAVADRGAGIPPDERERVFEPFFRGRDAGRGGLGLGLSIARGLVEAHGGRLWAEARAGGGTVFRFTLPVAREGVAAAA